MVESKVLFGCVGQASEWGLKRVGEKWGLEEGNERSEAAERLTGGRKSVGFGKHIHLSQKVKSSVT